MGVRMLAHAALPTRYGRFTIYGFKGRGPQEEAVALVRGNLNSRTAPLVRVHSQCLTGDVLASLRCDCRAQLELSMKKIGATKIRLLSNNPEKVRQLESSGIRVIERVPCQPRVSKISRAYLKTKKSKMGHLLEGV